MQDWRGRGDFQRGRSMRFLLLTCGETEGGPRPTLLRTHNLRGLVGWASAHLQGPSRIFGDSKSDVIGSEAVSFLSFRPSEHRERAEESVGRASGKSEIRNPKFKGWVGGCVLTCSSQACPERGRRPSRMDPSVRSGPSGLHSLGMTSCGAPMLLHVTQRLQHLLIRQGHL